MLATTRVEVYTIPDAKVITDALRGAGATVSDAGEGEEGVRVLEVEVSDVDVQVFVEEYLLDMEDDGTVSTGWNWNYP